MRSVAGLICECGERFVVRTHGPDGSVLTMIRARDVAAEELRKHLDGPCRVRFVPLKPSDWMRVVAEAERRWNRPTTMTVATAVVDQLTIELQSAPSGFVPCDDVEVDEVRERRAPGRAGGDTGEGEDGGGHESLEGSGS